MRHIVSFGTLLLAACGSATSEPTLVAPTSTTSARAPAVEAKASQVSPRPCTELDFAECLAACEKGNARGCTAAAGAVDQERRGTPEQRAQVPALFDKACEGGDPQGCHSLAYAYSGGWGVPKDPARSAKLFEKAFAEFGSRCEAGRAEACDYVAHMTSNGWGTTKNEEEALRLRRKAIEIYTAACGPADPASCAVAGDAHRAGFYVEKDVKQGRTLLETGCSANDPQSCFLLGLDRLYGAGDAPKDEAAAAPLLRKACDAGSLKACSSLGEQLALGKGVPRDPAAALKLLERACNGPGEILVAPACLAAAELRVQQGEPNTSPKVLALAERTCLLGFMNGCEAVEQLKKARE